VDESGQGFVYRWEAERGDCFRLFAVAAAPVDDLEVELSEVHGDRLSLTNQNRRWVVVDEDRPFCSARGGRLEARFGTHGGHGELAVAIWRGARMIGKPRKP